MSSRFSAARPKRAGEAFARAHHGEDADAGSSKKVKFDVRNPSALAPSARDDDGDAEDDVLAADVIGGLGRAMKRGAVNIDGYDSDSDNENFNARAEARGNKGEDVKLADVMDSYNSKGAKDEDDDDDDDDDEVDMFGDDDDDNEEDKSKKKGGRKDKEVRFLDDKDIEGQELGSKGGGTVQLEEGGGSSDEDEADVEAAIAEEGLDEEVGAGGLKKHAPKIDAFNMRQENEEGAFDEAGNYIRKAVDADAVHDRWLEGLSKKEIKKAAAAHEKRDAEQRRKQREDDSILTGDLLKSLILKLELGETALEALARLGKGLTKPKKVPKWKQKKMKGGDDAMDVDGEKEAQDPKQVKIKQAIDEITDAADKLLGRDYPNIYDTERERLVRIYRNETGEAWVESPERDGSDSDTPKNTMWEYRWVDGRDNADKQGPFDGPTMKAWQDAGYFGEGVEFRPAGEENGWKKAATFV